MDDPTVGWRLRKGAVAEAADALVLATGAHASSLVSRRLSVADPVVQARKWADIRMVYTAAPEGSNVLDATIIAEVARLERTATQMMDEYCLHTPGAITCTPQASVVQRLFINQPDGRLVCNRSIPPAASQACVERRLASAAALRAASDQLVHLRSPLETLAAQLLATAASRNVTAGLLTAAASEAHVAAWGATAGGTVDTRSLPEPSLSAHSTSALTESLAAVKAHLDPAGRIALHVLAWRIRMIQSTIVHIAPEDAADLGEQMQQGLDATLAEACSTGAPADASSTATPGHVNSTASPEQLVNEGRLPEEIAAEIARLAASWLIASVHRGTAVAPNATRANAASARPTATSNRAAAASGTPPRTCTSCGGSGCTLSELAGWQKELTERQKERMLVTMERYLASLFPDLLWGLSRDFDPAACHLQRSCVAMGLLSYLPIGYPPPGVSPAPWPPTAEQV